MLCVRVLAVLFDTKDSKDISSTDKRSSRICTYLRLQLASVCLSYLPPSAKLFLHNNNDDDSNDADLILILNECARLSLGVLSHPYSSQEGACVKEDLSADDRASQAAISCLATLINKVSNR